MLNAQLFAEAVYPRAYTAFGFNLLPFTLGHAVLLDRIRSPYSKGDNDTQIADALLVSMLCSVRFDEAWRLIGTRRFRWRLKMAGVWARLRWAGMLWRFEDLSLREYLANASQMPSISASKGETKHSTTPLYALLYVTLTSRCGFDPDKALATPLQLAIWLHCAYWESEDRLTMTPDEELELIASLKAAAAAKANG
jgi:hypothetical protein